MNAIKLRKYYLVTRKGLVRGTTLIRPDQFRALADGLKNGVRLMRHPPFAERVRLELASW